MDGRKTRGGRRARRGILALLAGSGALVITTAAFAAASAHAKFETWTVSIGGHTKNVRVGSTVKYSESAPLESITPEFKLTAKGEGLHHYSWRIVGPHHEETGVTEGSFTERSTVIDSPIIPLALALGPEGRARTQHETFDSGTYDLEVRVGSPKQISFYGEGRGKPALVVSLKLAKS